MANETFPLQVTTATEPGAGVTIVGQLDLSELEPALAPALADPTAKFKETDASRPPPAKPTVGPHRYTIYVPHDDGSRINIGAPHPLLGDTGISMRTQSHIHAFAYHGANATCLSLGGPSVSNGFTTNSCTSGYSLHTEGHSNHFAKLDVLMSSGTGGMTLMSNKDLSMTSRHASIGINAEKDVNVAAQGHIEISAGVEGPMPDGSTWDKIQALALIGVEVVDFGQPAIELGSERMGKGIKNNKENVNLVKMAASDEAKAIAAYVVNKSHTAIDKVLAHTATLVGLLLKFNKARKAPTEGESKFRTTTSAFFKVLPDCITEYVAIKKDLAAAAAKPSSGDVFISAKSNVNITADGSVSVAGTKGVTINGFRGVTIGGLTGSMKGHKSASIWGGMGATVSSLCGSVGISSDLSSASVKAKKAVDITSEKAKVSIAGEEDVQLNSVSGCGFVHGKAGAYIGAGEGNGMGIVMKSVYMTLGKHAKVDKFKDAVNKEDFGVIKIKDKSVKSSVTPDSYIDVTDERVELKTKTCVLTAARNMEIKGHKVLLG